MEVIDFVRERASAEKLDLPIVIDENIGGTHISNFLLDFLKFISSPYHTVE